MKNRGFISLILVVLISFSIWTILYSMTEKNELLFTYIRESRELQSARSAASECKMRAIELLTEDVHSHIVGEYENCSIDSVVTSLCTFDVCKNSEYGEVHNVQISGKGIASGRVFKIKTRLMFVNKPPFSIADISTERI